MVSNAFGGPANNVTIQFFTVKNLPTVSARNDRYPPRCEFAYRGTNWKVENCEVTLNHTIGVRIEYGIRFSTTISTRMGRSHRRRKWICRCAGHTIDTLCLHDPGQHNYEQ